MSRGEYGSGSWRGDGLFILIRPKKQNSVQMQPHVVESCIIVEFGL